MNLEGAHKRERSAVLRGVGVRDVSIITESKNTSQFICAFCEAREANEEQGI